MSSSLSSTAASTPVARSPIAPAAPAIVLGGWEVSGARSGAALPDPNELQVLFGRWHEAYRKDRPSEAARFFEQLRRDVLRIYYSSPQGWASLGYAGRVVHPQPSVDAQT